LPGNAIVVICSRPASPLPKALKGLARLEAATALGFGASQIFVVLAKSTDPKPMYAEYAGPRSSALRCYCAGTAARLRRGLNGEAAEACCWTPLQKYFPLVKTRLSDAGDGLRQFAAGHRINARPHDHFDRTNHRQLSNSHLPPPRVQTNALADNLSEVTASTDRSAVITALRTATSRRAATVPTGSSGAGSRRRAEFSESFGSM
jgi:hypothetical protein